MSNSFGKLFRITTWGESHGNGIGVVVDGCPPQIPISECEIQQELDRRRPGQNTLVTQRNEEDIVSILSGTLDGMTLGTPISMLVKNLDARVNDYKGMQNIYRPSHADYTYEQKYGIHAWAGSGRASARETIGRVAGGAIAKKILKLSHEIEILAWVDKVQKISCNIDPNLVSLEQIETSPIRCPDPEATEKMTQVIEQFREEGNSVGGTISCIVRGVPAGLGEPVFDKLEADLAKAMMSIPASKGFEIGSGFTGTDLTGLEHNDLFATDAKGKVITKTNHSGGIQGGISNGMPIFLRVAFKPTSTLLRPQLTINSNKEQAIIEPRGRHDPCVLPRAVPIVESMVALVLVDHLIRNQALGLQKSA